MSLGKNIYELRTAKNLSQGDLAEQLDVSRQSVSKWETDAAIPDLDKLIKMCDVFGVSLDELTGRERKEDTPPSVTVIEKSPTLTAQKIVGIVLLSISLIGGVLAFVLTDDIEQVFILFPFLAAMFVCSLICFLVKHNVGYWCAWAAFSPISLLSPFIVALPVFSSIGGSHIIFCVVMAFIANKLFNNTHIEIKKGKTIAIIVGWIAYVVSLVAKIMLAHFSTNSSYVFNFTLVNIVSYIVVSILLTYTVCYVKNIRHNKIAKN